MAMVRIGGILGNHYASMTTGSARGKLDVVMGTAARAQ
jgi:hypothetical protein